jgi:hypothetical protein
MMNRKSIIGIVVGLLLLTGIIGANLVMAGGQNTGRSVRNQEATTTDDDNLDCPAQGLPACQGQMNDEKSEGPENTAGDQNEKSEGSENEADDQNEKNEGPENQADDQNEAQEGAEGNG